MVLHGITAPHRLRIAQLHRDLMPLLAQPVNHLRRHAVLDRDLASGEAEFPEARTFKRRLKVHLEVRDIGDKLRMGLRLVEAAHDAERDTLIPPSA